MEADSDDTIEATLRAHSEITTATSLVRLLATELVTTRPQEVRVCPSMQMKMKRVVMEEKKPIIKTMMIINMSRRIRKQRSYMVR